MALKKFESNDLDELDKLTQAEYRLAGESIEEFEEFRVYKDEHGLIHRDDGPAVEWFSGPHEYWIHGKPMSEEEFNRRKSDD